MPRTAQCLCGAFNAVVSAEPVMVNVCHCQDCQRRSGVPWSSAAYFATESVRLDGPNRIYLRTSDAGTRINHYFCPTCGVTVCWARETGGTRFGIPVGLFNDRHSLRRRCRSGRKDDTRGRPPWTMSRIGTRNRLSLLRLAEALAAGRKRGDQPIRSSVALA
jgi:hypothetical protein